MYDEYVCMSLSASQGDARLEAWGQIANWQFLSVNSHGHVWYNSVSLFVNLCSSLCWWGQMITITMKYTQIKAQRLLGQKSCETTGINMVRTSVQHFYECLCILQKQQAYVKLALETPVSTQYFLQNITPSIEVNLPNTKLLRWTFHSTHATRHPQQKKWPRNSQRLITCLYNCTEISTRTLWR